MSDANRGSRCRGIAVGAALCAAVVSGSGCTDEPPQRVSLPPGYGDGLTGRAFTSDSTHYTLADLQTVALQLTLDASAHTILGHAEAQFRPVETGVPLFLLTPAVTAATLDGEPIRIGSVRDPDDATAFRHLGVALPGDSDHVLAIDYTIDIGTLSNSGTFVDGGVDFVTTMYDVAVPGSLVHGNYFEAYGPAGIEADQFQMSLQLEVVGTSAPHRVFANGSQQEIGPGRWRVEFPAYFSTSSFFVHVTRRAFEVRELTYQGLDHEIPITVYAPDATLTDDAVAMLPGLFAELEASFGPYQHASFTAYLNESNGMEHAGAMVGRAVSHELCHSWFARGVMPADGRSGWIDEAICTWRDRQYAPPIEGAFLESADVANYSMWYQQAAAPYHAVGSQILAKIDGLLADRGGLRPVLRTFYEQWRGKPITTEQFQTFLETQTGESFEPLFQWYVYADIPLHVAR